MDGMKTKGPNKLLTVNILGGTLHPDPSHLGSRLYGKSKIIEYNKHKIIMTVKPHYVGYVKRYMPIYLSKYNCTIISINEEDSTLYEHATVY